MAESHGTRVLGDHERSVAHCRHRDRREASAELMSMDDIRDPVIASAQTYHDHEDAKQLGDKAEYGTVRASKANAVCK